MYEEKKLYNIKWSTLASGTCIIKSRNPNSAINKLRNEIRDLKIKIDNLDYDEIKFEIQQV